MGARGRSVRVLPVPIHDCLAVYLNRRTGEFLNISAEDIRAAELHEDGEDEEEPPECQREILPKVQEALNSDDWLRLPSKFDIHEYAIMQEFCLSLKDSTLRGDLCDAIRGSGAFSRFNSMARRHGLIDAWYEFRGQAFEQIALRWLQSHGLAHRP